MQPRLPELLDRDDPRAAAADLRACQALLWRGSKSFAAASLLLPARVRRPAAALYAFCRMADDAVDESDDPGAVDALLERLDRVYAGRPFDSPIDRAFARMVSEADLPRPLVEALIEGFAWDAEGRRYSTLSSLCDYGARVAATVGAMMTLLMGARDAETLARACDLGVAMQLTNIARDVGEDARRGRIYLPLDWLDEAGIDAGAFIARPVFSPALGEVVARLLGHADVLYARADQGIGRLPRDCQAAIRAARAIYADIGRVIAAAGHDSVSRRAVVPALRKVRLLVGALLGAGGAKERERLLAGPAAPPLPETAFLVHAAAVGAA
ncbi:MAG: phytoene/squalene synthase family protein [Byssovorax sp.]